MRGRDSAIFSLVKKGLGLILLLVLIFFDCAFAQGAAVNDKATIYVYRRDREFFIYSFAFSRKLNVIFAGPEDKLGQTRRIARLKGKHHFTLEVPPGKYYFGTKSSGSVVDLEALAGGKYYVRYDQGKHCGTDTNKGWETGGCTESPPYVELVTDASVIAKDLSDLKPIGNSDRKDPIVQIPPGK